MPGTASLAPRAPARPPALRPRDVSSSRVGSFLASPRSSPPSPVAPATPPCPCVLSDVSIRGSDEPGSFLHRPRSEQHKRCSRGRTRLDTQALRGSAWHRHGIGGGNSRAFCPKCLPPRGPGDTGVRAPGRRARRPRLFSRCGLQEKMRTDLTPLRAELGGARACAAAAGATRRCARKVLSTPRLPRPILKSG